MTPLGAEWGEVAVTADLSATARDLSQLAFDFRQESRTWTHPAAREELARIGRVLVDQAQAAALASGTGDYYTRLEALQLALGQRAAARITLRLWWQRGELWNAHRMRPAPATVQTYLDRIAEEDTADD